MIWITDLPTHLTPLSRVNHTTRDTARSMANLVRFAVRLRAVDPTAMPPQVDNYEAVAPIAPTKKLHAPYQTKARLAAEAIELQELDP